MRKLEVVLLALSLIIISYMAWESRATITSVPIRIIIISSAVVIGSFAVHAFKWQLITKDFSIGNVLKYNSSQIMVPLPVPVQDPIRLKMLGWDSRTAANILWDRATDFAGLLLLASALLVVKFPGKLALILAGASVIAITYIVLEEPLRPFVRKIVPEETIQRFKKEAKKKPLQVASSIAVSMAFWSMNFYPIYAVLKSLGKSPGFLTTTTASASSLLLSMLNPLPMAAGSLEFFFSVATSVPFSVAMATMVIFRIITTGLQVLSSGITMTLSKYVQHS